jgi:hypothetical protein
VGACGPYFIVAIALVACGGETGTGAARVADDAGGSRSPGRRTADAAQGARGAASSTGGAESFGATTDGAPFRDPTENSACNFAHEVCGGLDSYVVVNGDGGSVRLAYPRDTGCGACTGGTCELWSFATEMCGGVAVQLAACAGPAGKTPCLDTASPKPSYTDLAGHVWTTAYLSGLASQPGVANASTKVLDLDLTLRIDDGAAMQELPVHIHTCGDIGTVSSPCH